ncbi:hypothetical protein CYLTODRAFT_489193 [Cylindrobasidium torrendii FP15055 ss-10]|uniref:RING-type E3 ubiquitin transferase n=1 Tax=Cylindrobasidium torrendii FP15055 ss-10 TaxID=1314674 RepID=A0A0D7BG80_9AGAR|nr:hypothetical protein CYLTODRAFT_489193 [Cylindrobasidium torrendii FP15055 ss-10]
MSASAPSTRRELDATDNCPICLEEFNDITYVPVCSHAFCFPCISTWAAQSKECPMCKQAIGNRLLRGARKRPHPLPLIPARPSQRYNEPFVRIRPPMTPTWGRRPDLATEEYRTSRSVGRRREVYEEGTYAVGVTYPLNAMHPTPAEFSANGSLVLRTESFVKRELMIWPHLDLDWLSSMIIDLMKTVDIRSEYAINMLAGFLDEPGQQKYARHFAHEVSTYVGAPIRNLFTYDSAVRY